MGRECVRSVIIMQQQQNIDLGKSERTRFSSQHSFMQSSKMFLPYTPKRKNDPVVEELRENGNITIYEDDVVIITQDTILTQVHKDILDIILTNVKSKKAIDLTELGEGKINIYIAKISKYQILKSTNKSVKNYKWLEEKLNEITKTVYTVQVAGSSRNINFTPIIHTIARKDSYVFLLHGSFIAVFFYLQPGIDYHLLLPKILEIKNNMVKALIRYCIANQFVKEDLFIILQKIGYVTIKSLSKRQLERLKATVRDYADVLNQFYIQYSYKKNYVTFNRTVLKDKINIYRTTDKNLNDGDILKTLLSLPSILELPHS